MAGVVVPKGSLYLNTTSGLAEPGGFLDRLTNALDTRSQFQGQLAGYGPALRDAGIPTAQPQGILSQFLGAVGLGGQQSQQSAPQMPVATSSMTDRTGAPAPTMGSAGPQAQPTSLASSGVSTGQSPFTPVFLNALASIESKGSGDYNAVGPDAGGGNRAVGRYQVMASNIGPWTKEVLGQAMTPQQFLASPQAQDAVAGAKFNQFLSQTGTPQDAASMWFSGRPYAQGAGRQDQLGTTGASYVRKFMAALPGGGGAPQDGGAPAQTTAYAPGDSSDPMPRAPAVQALNGAAPMPIARSEPNSTQSPQPPRPAAFGGDGSQSAQGSTVPAAAVLQPLMANSATRPQGTQAWRSYQQAVANGGAQGGLALPGGMSASSLAAMIAEPTTAQAGLQIFERSLFPTMTKLSPNESLYANGRFVSQAPSGPMDVGPGHELVDPNQRGGAGGGVIAAVPPQKSINVVNGRLLATNPLTAASTDVTPPGVPTTADLKGKEGLDANILGNVDKSRQQAIAATRTVDAISRTQTALDQGAITGGGADTKLKIRSLVSGILGVPDPGVEHTQEFQAAANSKAAELARQLSNSGHTTNADINMAKIMSGADINYSTNALREMARAQQQLALDTINRHNASVDEGSKWNSALAQGQGFYKVPVPQGYDFARAAALSNARDAINHGADRGAVMKRLQGAGYDPAQL